MLRKIRFCATVASAILVLGAGGALIASAAAYSVQIVSTTAGYNPATLTVAVGDTITWTNIDTAAPHTVTAQNGSFDSGFIAKGGTWSFTATTAGTFPYFCQFHPGMQATLIVTAAAPTATPTTPPPPPTATPPPPTATPQPPPPTATAQPPPATATPQPPPPTATPQPPPPAATATPQPPPATATPQPPPPTATPTDDDDDQGEDEDDQPERSTSAKHAHGGSGRHLGHIRAAASIKKD
ncbi:MAG TPA: cupredoxin family copper-binding protein [Chloroflexota bacterium]|nr:cupredoxin family copper-binding protein [Chloroflexota bacterium]